MSERYDDHERCGKNELPAVKGLDGKLIFGVEVPEGSGVLLGIGTRDRPWGGLSIDMKCGSRLDLRVTLKRIHGDGYLVYIRGERISGQVDYKIEEADADA